MTTIFEKYNALTTVPIETRFLSQRCIFLEDMITDKTAFDFMKQVLYLTSKDSKSPIEVFINSIGGEVTAGLLIYDVIQGCRTPPINLYCTGHAYSMAALILSSGEKGRRFILPNSKVMIHEPLLGNSISGNSSTVRSVSDGLLETRRHLNEILSKHTGKNIKAIEKATAFDNYLTAQEAVEFGIVDSIIEFNQLMKG